MISNLKGFRHKILKSNYNFDLSFLDVIQKIQNIPTWQTLQIESDLEYYKNSEISKKDLDQTIENFSKLYPDNRSNLARIRIQNNRLSFKKYFVFSHHTRFIKFVNFMKKCLETIKFPDVDFIITMQDDFDEHLDLIKAPIFCISKKKSNNRVVLFPHVEWMEKNDSLLKDIKITSQNLKWEKREDIAFWIGSSTGSLNIDENLRVKIVKLSKKYPDYINAAFSGLYQWDKRDQKRFLNEFILQETQSPHKWLKYKYLLSVDGNAFAGSFFWQLFSKSLVIKNKSEYIEWYYRGLQNNKHYIEYSDENDLLTIIKHLKKNDKDAFEISSEASNFAKDNLSNEAIVAYVYELLFRYSNTNLIFLVN